MKTTIALLCALALGGCATCERHPAACGVATAVLATSLALSIDGGRDSRSAPTARNASNCQAVRMTFSGYAPEPCH